MTTPTGTGTPDVPGHASTTTTTAGEGSGTVKQGIGTASDEAGRVVDVAKDQAQEVTSEFGTQARDLIGELKAQIRDKSVSQSDRLADNLWRLGDDLDGMTHSATSSGLTVDLTGMLASRVRDVSTFLGDHEPEELIDEIRQFARRRPGVFLLSAAVAGVAAGRLTRGAASSSGSRSSTGSTGRHRVSPDTSILPASATSPLQGTTPDDAVVGGTGVTAESFGNEAAGTASGRPGHAGSSKRTSGVLGRDEPLLREEGRP